MTFSTVAVKPEQISYAHFPAEMDFCDASLLDARWHYRDGRGWNLLGVSEFIFPCCRYVNQKSGLWCEESLQGKSQQHYIALFDAPCLQLRCDLRDRFDPYGFVCHSIYIGEMRLGGSFVDTSVFASSHIGVLKLPDCEVINSGAFRFADIDTLIAPKVKVIRTKGFMGSKFANPLQLDNCLMADMGAFANVSAPAIVLNNCRVVSPFSFVGCIVKNISLRSCEWLGYGSFFDCKRLETLDIRAAHGIISCDTFVYDRMSYRTYLEFTQGENYYCGFGDESWERQIGWSHSPSGFQFYDLQSNERMTVQQFVDDLVESNIPAAEFHKELFTLGMLPNDLYMQGFDEGYFKAWHCLMRHDTGLVTFRPFVNFYVQRGVFKRVLITDDLENFDKVIDWYNLYYEDEDFKEAHRFSDMVERV